VEQEETAIAGQRLDKEVSAEINRQATIEKLLEAVSSLWFDPSLHSEDQRENVHHTPCGGGFEYIHRRLQVVGGDEREPSVWGYNWAILFLGDINTETWPSRLR
jgi:hypothetical protein